MFINLDSAGLDDDILCSNVTIDFKGKNNISGDRLKWVNKVKYSIIFQNVEAYFGFNEYLFIKKV